MAQHTLSVEYATGRQFRYHTSNREKVRQIKRSVRKLSTLSGVQVQFSEVTD